MSNLQHRKAPTVFSRLSPAKPTIVFESYWHFAAERQEVFFRRLAGDPPPWTDDPIIRQYKFTNAYRASDRVSQYLIKSVIYRGDLPPDPTNVFFRVLLFKLFNSIETWRLLENRHGPLVAEEFDPKAYSQTLDRAMSEGDTIYSPAYIMPPASSFGFQRKHRNHLALLEAMMLDSLPERLLEAANMQDAYQLLRAYPYIGGFLAYQYVTDLNYTCHLNFKESEFVVPGPGARSGLAKCFSDFGGLNEVEMIRFVADRQEREFTERGVAFKTLWGRPLQLIDCQNLFCEVDKYARVRHPEMKRGSGRSRIKQTFAPVQDPISYWYPPKWGLNEAVAPARRSASVQAESSGT